METYKIDPNQTITLHILEGFYAAQAMVTIKAKGINDESKGKRVTFDVVYKNANGNSIGFPAILKLELEPPYFFNAGTLPNASPGPYYFVEITSSKYNPPLVIQVGFTNKLS